MHLLLTYRRQFIARCTSTLPTFAEDGFCVHNESLLDCWLNNLLFKIKMLLSERRLIQLKSFELISMS